jgi:hypothetical protein
LFSLCQCIDTVIQSGGIVGNYLKRFGHHWRTAGLVALLAVTALSATIEAGVLVPKFRPDGGGDGSGGSMGSAYSNVIQNVSLRPWTVTGVHLVDRRSSLELPNVTIVQLSLQHGPSRPLGTGLLRPLHRLTVGPGQQFTVNLVDKERDCPKTPTFQDSAEFARYVNSPANHQHSVPVAVTVATPLGTKTIGTTFTISCST